MRSDDRRSYIDRCEQARCNPDARNPSRAPGSSNKIHRTGIPQATLESHLGSRCDRRYPTASGLRHPKTQTADRTRPIAALPTDRKRRAGTTPARQDRDVRPSGMSIATSRRHKRSYRTAPDLNARHKMHPDGSSPPCDLATQHRTHPRAKQLVRRTMSPAAL